jgi:hypothetical protein
MATSMTVVSSVVSCGERTASAKSAKERPGGRAPVNTLSERLAVDHSAG